MQNINCEFMYSIHQIMGIEIKIRRPDNFIHITNLANLLDHPGNDLHSTRWFKDMVKRLKIENPLEVWHGGRGASSWIHPDVALACCTYYRRSVKSRLMEALAEFRRSEEYGVFYVNSALAQGVMPPDNVKILPMVYDNSQGLKISSKIVSDGFGYSRHREFINTLLNNVDFLGAVETANIKTTTGGNDRKEAFLTEYQICLLPAICKPTSQVKDFQKRLVNSFWALRNLRKPKELR